MLRLARLFCGGLVLASPTHGGFARSFNEENYKCSAEEGFVAKVRERLAIDSAPREENRSLKQILFPKCVPKWQEDCRRIYSHAPELQHQLCETHLDRNYVKIRTLLPDTDILTNWKWDRNRRDYDVGWVRKEFPKFTRKGAVYLPFGTPQGLPADLHSKMLEWYERNRAYTTPESSQPAFGYNCNTGHDNDDWVVSFQPNTQEDQKIHAAVKEWIRSNLAKWTGEDVNELTAIYGAREYHRGSVCGMHTDAMQTHAFSAIYQLDQQGMDEPWALDYVTHEGVEERVYQTPGDIVLYEGASSESSPHRHIQFLLLGYLLIPAACCAPVLLRSC